jgi:hypothetical protein
VSSPVEFEPAARPDVVAGTTSRSAPKLLLRAVVREWLAVTALFLSLGCVLTWPLVTRMSSGFYGFGNDNWGGIWFGHWIHEAFWGPQKTSFSREIQFPFGFQFDDRYIQPYDRLIDIVFGGIGNGLFAYNLMILLSFPLAGLAMYALARYLTQSRPAAIVAGLIFAASPFHLAMSMQYPPMASIHVAPLFVLAMLVALRRRRLRDAALAGAAFALVWLTSYYYGWFAIWFALVALLAFTVGGLWRAWRERRVRIAIRDGVWFATTRGAVAGATFLVVAAPLLVNLASKVLSDQDRYARQEADLAYTAVRPWQYLLPPGDSTVFGKLTRNVIDRHLGILPVYEQNVYLGAIAVALALVAIVAIRTTLPHARAATLPLLLSAGFCAIVTLGPTIPYEVTSIGDWLSPGTNPHFKGPVSFLYDLSPNFRYYGRAFVFVSVVLAALAAIGFALLVRRVGRGRPSWVPWALAAVVSGLVLAEFVNIPPRRFVSLHTPPWVQAVKRLPKGAPIIEYPVADYSSPRSLQYVYWQTRHGHPTVNPPETPTSQAFERSVDDPDSYLSGRTLSRAGVKFAVVHTKLKPATFPPYQPAFQTDQLPASAGHRNPWFREYARTSDAIVYRVLPRPRADVDYAVAGFSAGWGDFEVDPTGRWRWARNRQSVMTVYASRDYPRAALSFDATSFQQARTLRIAMDGRELARLEVPAGRAINVKVSLRLHRGAQAIQLTTDPAPVVADQVMHNGDLRALSVRVGQVRVTAKSGG